MTRVPDLYLLSSSPIADASFVSAAIVAALAAVVVGGALAAVVTLIEAGISASEQQREPLMQLFLNRVLGRASMRALVPPADADPR